MSFNSAIPQSTDLISVSQQDLLNNFTSMQSTYTTDHYGFNPVTNLGFHKHVTMGNDPLNIPAPGAGFGAEFATTVNSATYPFWVRDGITTQYPMVLIKAYTRFNVNGAVITPLFTLPYGNVSSIVRSGVGTINVNFTNAFPNNTYAAMASFNSLQSGGLQVAANANTGAAGIILTANSSGVLQDLNQTISVIFFY
jgi:hypothetical protein